MVRHSLSRFAVVVLAAGLVAAGCGNGDGEAGGADRLVVLTHDSFAVSDGVLADFEAETGITVEILRAGDAGEMVNKAILTRDNPLADVLYGVDNTFLSRALVEEIFEPYRPDALAGVDPALDLDPDGRVTPIDFGDVCINYDREFFAGRDIPARLTDLTGPDAAGLLAVEDPALSSPGLAFLLATIGTFGEESDYTWRDFWTDLKAGDVLVTAGWEQAYYEAFTRAGGDRPLVVSYASSPPAEVFFSETPLTQAPTGVMTDGCFRQIEFAGILAGTEARTAAERWIDFMLSERFQEDIPLTMFVFPAVEDAALPDVFTEYAIVPDRPVTLPPSMIEANRDRWLAEWSDLMRG